MGLLFESTEIESEKRNDRRALLQALSQCKLHRATLVIAKIDRLSRDAHFLPGLDTAGVEFLAVDMPNANRLTVGIMALVAEEERRMISARTTEAVSEIQSTIALLTLGHSDNQGRPERRCILARHQLLPRSFMGYCDRAVLHQMNAVRFGSRTAT